MAEWGILDDPLQDGTRAMWSKCNFYIAPLGVDAEIFQPARPVRKNFLIGTSGYIADTESVREAHLACQMLNRSMFHLGPNLEIGNNITYVHHIPDELLAEFWSQCSYVAGLRRIEGFELPVLEGLMCGARPIVFDAVHYTKWFGEFAELVPEGSPQEVLESLVQVMSKPVRPVTAAERSQVAKQFDWQTIVTNFWEAIR
jgi:glycosyltransferase involved in cell wall biosynthesis